MSGFKAYVEGSSQKIAHGTSALQRSAGASARHLIGLNSLIGPYTQDLGTFLERAAMHESILPI